MIRIKKGLDIPIYGSPADNIVDSKITRSVAVLGNDYIGMKPTMLVEEGDSVKLGQALFEDKKNPGVIITSPAGGKIESINRGDRRALQSIVIEIEAEEEIEEFKSYSNEALDSVSSDDIRHQLIKSGMWTAFRTRPYSKIPAVDSSPSNIFISVLDTEPLSPDPEKIVNKRSEDFNFGLSVLKKLVDCPIHLSVSENSQLEIEEDASSSISSCEFSETDKCIGQSTNFFRTERPKLKSSERLLTIFSGSGLSGSVSKTEMNIFEGEESTAGILL